MRILRYPSSLIFSSDVKRKKNYFALAFLCATHSSALAQFNLPVQTETTSLEEIDPNRPSVFDSSAYIETGYTTDHLTNNYRTWESQYINFFVPLKKNGLFNIQLDNVTRYGLNDQVISGTYAYPFKYGVLNIEGYYSANAAYLAKTAYGATWNGRLPESFGYILGATQRQYLESQSNIYKLGVEKYLGQYRFAYVGILSTINLTQPSFAQLFQAQWVGATNNRFGVSYSQGSEPMVVTQGTLASVKTQYMQLDALYWINKKIGVTLALWHGMQGDFYQRNGGLIGLRFNLE